VLQVLEGADNASGDVKVHSAGTVASLQAWPVRNASGQTTRAIVLARGAGAGEAASPGLKDREWLYRNLAERCTAGMVMVGPDGKVQYANRALCAALAMPEDEVSGRPVEELLDGARAEEFRACLSEAVERGESSATLVLRKGDGGASPAQVCMARFTTSDGTYVVLTVQPSAGGLASALEEGVDRLECGIVALDANGCVTWANGLACGLIGRERKDLLGSRYLDAVDAGLRGVVSDGDRFAEALQAAHDAGQALEAFPVAVGSEELSYWSTPVPGGSRDVARVEHFYQAGTAGGAPGGENLLAGLAATVPEMLFTAEAAGRFTWCSAGAAQTVGYGEKQLLGMALADLVASEDRGKLREVVSRALGAGRQVQTAELIMTRADGGRFWGELSLRGDTKSGLQGFLCDVTERRMARAVRDIVSGERPL
jgi:PAS domain S-box-containing protein